MKGRMECMKEGCGSMARTVGIGYQDFAKVRQEHIFYVDKTNFIREWWEGKDEVTLITRPGVLVRH